MYKYLELKNRIIDGIVRGRWPVGSILPKENELVAQFNISQSTVCNAMRALVTEGYIRRRKNVGTIVINDKPIADNVPEPAEIYVAGMPPAQYAHTINWFVSEECLRGILNNASYPVKMMRASEFVKKWGAVCSVPPSPARRRVPAGPPGACAARPVGSFRLPEPEGIIGSGRLISDAGRPPVRRGLILSDPEPDILARVKDLPCVCINRLASKFLPFNSVNNDSAQTGYQSISYLAHELGHQKIAIVWGGQLYHQDFMAGCRRAFSMFALALDENLVVDTRGGGEEAGYAAGQKLLKRRKQFTAVCVDTDYKALGLIKALCAAGARVSEDISVIGADDIPEISEKNGLTTINRAFYETGEQAVKMLEKRLADPDLKPASVMICGHIVERQTCRKI
ncbi:MAG: GntR family transcriptional regulator [Kiritimatiellae bacterium]|nr:GntR family transcriptional regulator [Kiritimatiellia bacterium]